MNESSLAESISVVYTTYRRTRSLIRSVEAVASELPYSNIYIYSDSSPAHSSPACREEITAHRRELRSHFSSSERVCIIERNRNYGMKNAIHAIDAHLRSGPVLFFEDDIVPVRGFSRFILSLSESLWTDHSVTSLSLYNPLSTYASCQTPIRITRTSMYGAFLWPHKLNLLHRIRQCEIACLHNSNELMAKVLSVLSPEGLGFSLLDHYCKKFNALDCRLTFRQALYGLHGIVPPVNLVENHGLSGDGANCPDSRRLRELFSVKPILACRQEEGLSLPPSPYSVQYDIDAAHLPIHEPGTIDSRIYQISNPWERFVDIHLRSHFKYRTYHTKSFIAKIARAALQ